MADDRDDGARLLELVEGGEVARALALLARRDGLPLGTDGRALVLAALEFGSAELVRAVLARGAPVDVETDQGTLAHEAVDVESDDAAAVLEAVLDAGARTDGHGVNGWTPLHLAAAWGTPAQMLALLRHGAAVDARASLDGGPTALQAAAYVGRADSVEVLLRHGADRRLKDDFGTTPRREAERAMEGPGAGARLVPLLKAGGLAASAGRWLHEEVGLTGEAGEHREVVALLDLG